MGAQGGSRPLQSARRIPILMTPNQPFVGREMTP